MISNIGASAKVASIKNNAALTTNNINANKAMQRVTTGMRINSAQDGSAQWAVSEKMRERINSLNQASLNIQNDNNMLKTAETGINNTVSILQTLKARVLQAADASTNDEDRVAIAKEMYSLFKQIDENATSTRYNGKLLLTTADSGSFAKTGDTSGVVTGLGSKAQSANQYFTFQIGDDHGSIISNVKIENMTLKGLGLTGSNRMGVNALDLVEKVAILDNDTKNATAQIGAAQKALGFTSIQTGTTPLVTYQSTTNAGKMLIALDDALNKALKTATDIGAYEQRLGYTADNVSAQIENLEASDSTIRDADMAREISDYMKWSVLSQASQYMLAQSNQNAFQVLNLLQ